MVVAGCFDLQQLLARRPRRQEIEQHGPLLQPGTAQVAWSSDVGYRQSLSLLEQASLDELLDASTKSVIMTQYLIFSLSFFLWQSTNLPAFAIVKQHPVIDAVFNFSGILDHLGE